MELLPTRPEPAFGGHRHPSKRSFAFRLALVLGPLLVASCGGGAREPPSPDRDGQASIDAAAKSQSDVDPTMQSDYNVADPPSEAIDLSLPVGKD